MKYYDSSWHPILNGNNKPMYYSKFQKINTLYDCTTYYFPSMSIYSKGNYTDTFFSKNIGLKLSFYQSGVTKDSILNSIHGGLIYSYSFFESKKLQSKTIYGRHKDEYETNVYFENGKLRVHSYWDKEKKIN